MSSYHLYNTNHKERARTLRKEMTPEEQAVWQALRRKQIQGATFHRQKPLHHFIVDFYCPKAGLVVEIDGGQHHQPDHEDADRQRDEILGSMGLQVLRFTNLQVKRQLAAVVGEIDRVTAERLEALAEA